MHHLKSSLLTPEDVLRWLEARPSLNLFPTENRMSPRALRALSCDGVHRYPSAEGPDFFYGDTMGLAQVYERCAQLACEFFGARYAFVNLLSGLHTMHAVISSLCKPRHRVFIMDPTCGGHYATRSICEGYQLDVEYLPFDRESSLIDLDSLARMASERPPNLVYLDVSTIVRFPRMVEIRRAVGPQVTICLDASHILGLLPSTADGTGLGAGGSTCSGSTHKTLPGPQKGLFLTDDARIAERFQARLPFLVSSAHATSVGALAITLQEMMEDRAPYGRAVRGNAQALARRLAAHGFSVPGVAFGYTETHQVWIVPPQPTMAIEWGKRLLAACVRSTVVRLPVNGQPGLRFGVQELTRLGMGEAEMEKVAQICAHCLVQEKPVEGLRRDVAELSLAFPNPQFVRD